MKKKSLLITLFYLLSSLVSFAQDAKNKIAFVHVNVIPLTHEVVLKDQTVLVENDVITFVGKYSKDLKNFTIVDGTNKFLIPGFADMHAHLPGFQSQSFPNEQYLLLNLSQGITAVRGMRGHPSQLEMRRDLVLKNAWAPTIFVSSPPITKQNKELNEVNAESIFQSYYSQGYDFIKILSIDTSLYSKIMPVIKRNKWTIAGHSPDGFLSRAVSFNQNSIEHIEPFVNSFAKDSVKTLALFREMEKAKIFHCPDVYWYYVFGFQFSLDSLKKANGIEFIKNEMKQNWFEKWEQKLNNISGLEKLQTNNSDRLTLYLKLLKRMEQIGVPLLVSAGDGEFIIPGYGYHEEMKIFARAGVSPYNILRATSYNAASFFGQADKWGSIEKGKRADLILLNANPLDNIHNVDKIEGITIKGKWLSKKSMEQMLSAYRE